MAKKRILFIHDAYPNQLSAIHEHFRATGEVDSFCLTQEVSRSFRQYEKNFPSHVLSYVPEGEVGADTYYYTVEGETIARGAVNVRRAVLRLLEHQPLDLIMASDRSGHPHLLFDGIGGIPIVGYSEFPDYETYGFDERYPPLPEQMHLNAFSQAYTFQSVIKSAVTVVPSHHARMMYPEMLRSKIVVQMDAFDAQQRRIYTQGAAAFAKEPGLTYVGFASNVLTSEKGLEHFIQITKRLSSECPAMRFVVIGAEIGFARYGFERQFLDRLYGANTKSFLEYLFEKYEVDRSKYIVTGLLSGEVFSSTLFDVDFFLYPLQYGSANWGFFELLIRGKIVVASDRCYIPEVITQGVNGYMLPLNDIDSWVATAKDIAANPTKYAPVGETAKDMARQYHVDVVAQKYLEIFEQWAWNKA